MKIPIAKSEYIKNKSFFKQAFKKLKLINSNDYNSIISRYVELFDAYPVIPLNISKTDLTLLKTYRSISENDFLKLGIKKSLLSSFSHPTKIVTPQRFNIKDFPVLYTASDPATAIMEKGYDSKNLFWYISEWKFSKNTHLSYVKLFSKRFFSDEFKDIPENFERKWKNSFRIYNKNTRRSLEFYITELIELCLQDEFSPLTSAIGHYYLYKVSSDFNHPIGFIVYPSIRQKINCINYAFKPSLIKENILTCSQIWRIKIKNYTKKHISFNLYEIGNINMNLVEWKSFNYNINKIQFYNEDGGIIEEIINNKKKLVMKLNNNLITYTAYEFINRYCSLLINEEVKNLSKEKDLVIEKLYWITLDSDEIILKEKLCRKISFNITYTFTITEQND